MEELIAKIIESVFAQKWALLSSPPIVKYKNVAFIQPTNGEWITLTIVPGSAFQASMGPQFVSRQLGIVLFQIFTPKNTGDRRAKAISDMIQTVFRGNQWGYDAENNLYLQAGAITTIQPFNQPLTTEDGQPITTEGGQDIMTEVQTAEMVFAILFREPDARDVPGGRDFYQLNVRVPFQADKINP